MTAPTQATVWLTEPPHDDAHRARIEQVLHRFTPHVLRAHKHTQLYFLDARGLAALYGDHGQWARALLQALMAVTPVSVVLGFHRLHGWLLAESGAPMSLREAASAEAERQQLGTWPLSALVHERAWTPRAIELGVRTLAALWALPDSEVGLKLGSQALQFVRWAQGPDHVPAHACTVAEPCTVELPVEPADDDVYRLLFGCKTLLPKLIAQAQRRRSIVAAIELTLVIEPPHTLCRKAPERLARTIEAGRPGRGEGGWVEGGWVELFRLALEAWPLERPVQQIVLTAKLVAPNAEQLALWPAAHARPPAQTLRALGELRACFGPQAVTCARLVAAHRPEARYRYEPVRALPPARALPATRPASAPQGSQPLVRRMRATPGPLPAPLKNLLARSLRAQAKAPHLALLEHHPAAVGPVRLSGQWWQAPCDRDYYSVRDEAGTWHWIYFDRQARQWLSQGTLD